MVYKLVSEWSDGVEHQIIMYRYNMNWDNIVKYTREFNSETSKVIITKEVFGLSKIERLTKVYEKNDC